MLMLVRPLEIYILSRLVVLFRDWVIRVMRLYFKFGLINLLLSLSLMSSPNEKNVEKVLLYGILGKNVGIRKIGQFEQILEYYWRSNCDFAIVGFNKSKQLVDNHRQTIWMGSTLAGAYQVGELTQASHILIGYINPVEDGYVVKFDLYNKSNMNKTKSWIKKLPVDFVGIAACIREMTNSWFQVDITVISNTFQNNLKGMLPFYAKWYNMVNSFSLY